MVEQAKVVIGCIAGGDGRQLALTVRSTQVLTLEQRVGTIEQTDVAPGTDHDALLAVGLELETFVVGQRAVYF